MKKFLSQLIKENIRISLIDGELSVKVPKTGVDNAIIEEIKSKKKDLIAYLSDLKKNDDTNSVVINKVAEHKDYQLSNAQHRLWILNQFKDQAPAYNIFTQIPLRGSYDVACFERALFSVIERHEILRTVFRELDTGEVRQFVLSTDELGFVFDYQDFRGFDDPEGSGTSYMQEDFYKPFDLEKGPLLRVSLLQLSDDHYIFYLNMHHIISDGWSLEVLSRDVILYYEAYTQNTEPVISPLRIQYKDYANWQFNQLSDSTYKDREDYWLTRLSGDLPRIDLPTSKQRPKFKTSNGRYLSTYLDKDLSAQMQSFIKQHQGSLFMLTLSAINVLLYKYTSNKDILIGSPVAGRSHGDLEDQIGFYVNVLALRNDLDPSSTFADFYHKIKENTIQDFEHQEYPYDKLVESLGIGFDASRASLYDVLLTFHGNSVDQKKFEIEESLCNEIRDRGVVANKNDIEFHLMPMGDVISFEIIFNDDLYDTSMITKMMHHFKQLLSSLLSDPNQLLGSVDYLSREEKRELLEDLNATDTSFCSKKTLVDLFRDQVIRTPDAVALVFEQMELTYQELDDRSNTLANYLITHHNIGIGDLVGIKMERSEWLMISILAVLKAGGAYVPLDANYPEQRVKFIEEDSNCKLIVDNSIIRDFNGYNDISTDFPELNFSSNDVAYIIYTSGSTGKPKGVMITHSNAVAMLQWAIVEFADTGFEMLYAVTSHCFDLSVYEMFFPLFIGKKIRILPNGLSIGDYLIIDKNVLINTVPSVLNTLIEKNTSFSNVVAINLAGEPFPLRLAEHFNNSGIVLRNLYGPSEDTTYSSCFEVKKSYSSSVPIGKPINNTRFYILSDELALQPKGIIGELCISGSGLAKGYLNRPELTNEKFIANPFEEGGRMYKTGDLARWLPDGNMEFLGRRDSQVKIRGYRIEMGEIENELAQQEGVSECVVLVQSFDQNQVIVAYLVSNIVIDKQKLRLDLSKNLPDYMLPTYFVLVDKIPLTPNGKIDKKALPPLDFDKVTSQKYVAPKTHLEKELVSICQEVLGIDKIGVNDDFIELGINSLSAIKINSRIKKNLSLDIDIKSLFHFRTVNELAFQLDFSEKQKAIKSNKKTLKKIEL